MIPRTRSTHFISIFMQQYATCGKVPLAALSERTMTPLPLLATADLYTQEKISDVLKLCIHAD
jgi:hypothetical protein